MLLSLLCIPFPGAPHRALSTFLFRSLPAASVHIISSSRSTHAHFAAAMFSLSVPRYCTLKKGRTKKTGQYRTRTATSDYINTSDEPCRRSIFSTSATPWFRCSHWTLFLFLFSFPGDGFHSSPFRHTRIRAAVSILRLLPTQSFSLQSVCAALSTDTASLPDPVASFHCSDGGAFGFRFTLQRCGLCVCVCER